MSTTKPFISLRLSSAAGCFWIFALTAFAAATDAHAQTAPAPNYGIGDAIKESQPPRPESAPRPPAPELVQPEAQPSYVQPGETLQVRAFKLEGAKSIPHAELQEVLAPYVEKALSLAQIQEAADKITALYRSRGYLLARAYVPQQDARSGIVEIDILEGRYGKFSFHNQSLVRDRLIRRVFEPLENRSEHAVSQFELEKAMLLVSDIPGTQLPRLTVTPGEASGTSDFDVTIDPGKRWDAYLLADNQGSRYTGRNRVSAGISVNSPFGFVDRIGLDLLGAEAGGLDNAKLAYNFPLSADGLRGELAGSRTTYQLGDIYRDLGAKGTAHTFEASFIYPVQRQREQNLYLSFNLATKRLRDEFDVGGSSNSRSVTVGTFGVLREKWSSMLGLPSYMTLNAGLTYGHLDIEDATQEALNRAGANTVGDFAHVNLGGSVTLDLGRGWSFATTVTAQKALLNKNLDSTEQMSITGTSGVKAYREWVSGDNAYLLDVEARYALPPANGLSHAVGLFGDLGHAYYENSGYSANKGAYLSDVGLAYYLRYKTIVAKVQYAHAIGPHERAVDGQARSRVLAQLGTQF